MENTQKQIENAFKSANKLVYASSMTALNRTAYKIAKEDLPKIMEQVFHRPTKWVTRGINYVKADKTRQSVKVLLPDWAPKGVGTARILAAHIQGGARELKASEKKMQASGILPKGMYIAPGSKMRLNAYGNIPQSQMIRIMSALDVWARSGMQSGFNAGQTAESRKRNKKAYTRLFVVNTRNSNLPMGIYNRSANNKNIKQLIAFIRRPYYKVRFKFYEEASKIFDKVYIQEFRKAFDDYSNRNIMRETHGLDSSKEIF